MKIKRARMAMVLERRKNKTYSMHHPKLFCSIKLCHLLPFFTVVLFGFEPVLRHCVGFHLVSFHSISCRFH